MDTNEEGLTGTEDGSEEKPQAVDSSFADPSGTAMPATRDRIRRFRETNQETLKGPVPVNVHYEICRGVEKRLHEYLGGLDHEYLLAGLRVAYDFLDSSNEPNVLPYSVEYGYLAPVDEAIADEDKGEVLSTEEVQTLFQDSPISLELLNELFASTRDELQDSAKERLRTGVFIGLRGSPLATVAAWCGCANDTVKYCVYNSEGERVFCGLCTTTACSTVL
jgi:hypothetical protein